LLDKYNGRHPINIGNTTEYSVKQTAEMITQIMDYKGNIMWDSSQPSGQHRKPSDNSKLLKLGWKTNDYTPFEKALQNTCEWFVKNYPNVRGIR